MTDVLLERVDWIEDALNNQQITLQEAMSEIDEINLIIDARDLSEAVNLVSK